MQLPDFALRVHSADGVGPACVLLQDRFGVDVNVLLFAARVGTRGPLTPPVLQSATARVAQWHAEVVRPLRGVRRRLKSGPAPAPSPATAELREQLQGLEIRAELIELGELDALVPDTAAVTDDPTAQVTAALLLVLRAHSQRPLTADEDAALATIAAAAAAAA
ncbi:TIGR02444 family protein [Mycolicibacterium brisbanense]|uniref:TIGR02444 family protein n=1 Tax=Mycolicibacterium brisbanense TaxID=146020 RepID=UPI000AEF0B7B|nr:TIGR02444 family protein [Mycolicibacterium brisbanense]MCV7160733.1 TIGR02444 family protein [Mycolicibacterium brisbanense]